MPRPRKSTPDLYWLEAKQTYCVNINGKRHLLGKDRKVADQKRLDLITQNHAAQKAAQDGGIDPIGNPGQSADALLAVEMRDRSVAEVLLQYRKNLRSNMDAKHVARIDKAIALLVDRYGALPAVSLSPLHLLELRKAILADPAEYSRRYVNHLLKCLKTAWRWAIAMVLVAGPNAQGVLALKMLEEGDGGQESPPRLPADPQVVEKTLPHLTPLLRDVVRLLQITGMRPGEVLAMRRCDVSTSAEEKLQALPGWQVSAMVAGGMSVWLYVPPGHKTKRKGKARVVALGPRAQEILAPLLAGLAPQDRVFTPKRAEEIRHAAMRAARKTPVQPSQQDRRKGNPLWVAGDVYTTEALDKAIRLACAAAGVTPWTPYQLRHGRATQTAEVHGEDLAAEMLGHAAGSNVTGTYTRTKLARLLDLAAREG